MPTPCPAPPSPQVRTASGLVVDLPASGEPAAAAAAPAAAPAAAGGARRSLLEGFTSCEYTRECIVTSTGPLCQNVPTCDAWCGGFDTRDCDSCTSQCLRNVGYLF